MIKDFGKDDLLKPMDEEPFEEYIPSWWQRILWPIMRWLWWCWGPANVWLIAREYKRDHEQWPTWTWNDHGEHCPHCGNENMTEQAYDDLAHANAMGVECDTCRTVTGGSPAHHEYGGTWWVIEVTCFRCGHAYEHEDSSV